MYIVFKSLYIFEVKRTRDILEKGPDYKKLTKTQGLKYFPQIRKTNKKKTIFAKSCNKLLKKKRNTEKLYTCNIYTRIYIYTYRNIIYTKKGKKN